VKAKQRDDTAVLADDFALERVPPAGRTPMLNILWVELGIVTAMSEFVVASALGYGMTFWRALLATLVGTLLLLLVSVLVGVAGSNEGLPTGLLARWSGFGRYGSMLISFIVVIGCTAWFGVQNSICAEAIVRATHSHVGMALASVLSGSIVILIASLGIHWVSKTASFVVPLFTVLVIYGCYRVLSSSSLSDIVLASAPGPSLTLATGASMVVGGAMLGGIVAPDFTRFCRTGKDVLWVMLISLIVGQFGLGTAGILLSHAARTQDVIAIIFGVAGWLGLAIVALATLKLNDANLYSASLHAANAIEIVFGHKMNRGILTIILGSVGILFSILGILQHIVGFLLILGVAVPPIGGVLIVDYFLLARDRQSFALTRASNSLPPSSESVNPVALLAWLAGFLVGESLHIGVASVNSIIAAGIVYYAVMKTMAVLSKRPIKYFRTVPTISSQS
jgi:cytosine permease